MALHKYPRTRHLPWSPGASADDLGSDDVAAFVGRRVVVTEKMDGENTSLYRQHIHARSTDGRHHPSRDWVKARHGQMAHLIPEGWRLCGENLYARHSLAYTELASYFLLFSVWDADNRCLPWGETKDWARRLGLAMVPEIYEGIFDEAVLRARKVDTTQSEGYVVRLREGFAFDEFSSSVAKWVRPGHVQSPRHWMHEAVVPNQLASQQVVSS